MIQSMITSNFIRIKKNNDIIFKFISYQLNMNPFIRSMRKPIFDDADFNHHPRSMRSPSPSFGNRQLLNGNQFYHAPRSLSKPPSTPQMRV